MAHPRKKRRTQAPGKTQTAGANGVANNNPAARIPRSMVIRMGATAVGPGVSQLAQDLRSVMEPHTAARLKERRSNRLRDFTSMAGPLGVSHLLIFTRTSSGNTNLRIAVHPRGPTLSFRVEKYSLCRDIVKSQRHPKSGVQGVDLQPPLLVMNNFLSSSTTSNTSTPKHLESLTTSVFQSLFPTINPTKTPLDRVRRVLLLDRSPHHTDEDGTYVINLRHYAITAKPMIPLSRGIQRLKKLEKLTMAQVRKSQSTISDGTKSKPRRGLPDLSRLDDVADYILDPSAAGFTSASESEVETDAEVEVVEAPARKVLSRQERQRQREKREADAAAAKPEGTNTPDDSIAVTNGVDADTVRQPLRKGPKTLKKAIRLTEIGPRMTLRLVKVEEGECGGKVMWHEFVTKTAEEEKTMEKVWEQRRKEKEERRRVQKENVERKRQERASAKDGKPADGREDGDEDEDMDDEEGEWDDDDDMVNEDQAREEEMEVDEEHER